MAWIIVSANDDELDRRELTAPVVIGRASDCEIAVRDILLSRHHCRIEPAGGHDWRIVDLKSKNGTRVGWQEVTEQVLRNGDHLRMGRTRITYYTTEFEPPPPDRKPKADRIVRPADPHEALSGTVTDFVLVEEDHPLPHHDIHHQTDRTLPEPKPQAHAERVRPSLLDELASTLQGDAASPGTSTATVATTTRTVARALPRVPVRGMGQAHRRPGSGETDLSLQLSSQVDDYTLPEAQTPPPLFTRPAVKPSKRKRLLVTVALTLAAAIGTGIVVVSLWLLMLAPR